jgi:hypothetical protein
MADFPAFLEPARERGYRAPVADPGRFIPVSFTHRRYRRLTGCSLGLFGLGAFQETWVAETREEKRE